MIDLETHEYPIDTSTLQKGSVVTAETIASAFGVRIGTEAFQLASMRCGSYITMRLAERDLFVTVAQRKHDLVVLTDDEASSYNAKRFGASFRAAARASRRMSAVDRSQLDPKRIESHDRTLEVQGRMLSAARRARREVTPLPRERQTPALAEPKKETP